MVNEFDDYFDDSNKVVDPSFFDIKLPDSEAPVSTLVEPPKRRGRPPGSKNKVDSTKTDKNAKIKARQEAYSKMITDDFNDYVMSALITIGIPAEYIYKEGKAPIAIASYDKYTDLGNALAIKPVQAKVIANFMAAVENTDGTSKYVEKYTNGRAAIALKGLLAIGATGIYLGQINKVMVKLMPFIKAKREAESGQGSDDSE
ncbi:MAG: hypothetical protein QXL94_02970 [Candidatus Parvarchaeum sp.]